MIATRISFAPYIAACLFVSLAIVASASFSGGSAAWAAVPDRGDAPTGSAVSASGYPVHYIVFEQDAAGDIQPLLYSPVQSRVRPTGLGRAELAARLDNPSRNAEALVAEVITSSGKSVFRTLVEVPRWLRGEFHGAKPGDPIDGHIWPAERPAFVVRVPAIAGASLVLRGVPSGALAEFDLDQLARTTQRIPPSSSDRVAPLNIDSPANRVDMLVMGDGYTAAQESEFSSDAASVVESFFSVTPLKEYSTYVNGELLFTPSAQSGADHPPYQAGCTTLNCCADSAALSDPLGGTFVNTAFDAHFCAQNLHRLLVVDHAKVYAAAAAAPDWDVILVVVNDSAYGGSGGAFAVVSANFLAPQIAVHEYGHSFAGLGDEYENSYPGYPSCSDVDGFSRCEANVTDVTERSRIKWSPWFNDATPIPTIPENDPQWAKVVGLFEGARYQSTGMYRSGQNCVMRTLGQPFCQVPGQAYILRLYTGGWGEPASGIQLIEPGSASPATVPITLKPGQSQVFHADVLEPMAEPEVHIQWLINGAVAPGADGDTFTYTAGNSTPADVEIKLLVEDVTPLVNSHTVGNALKSSYTWIVSVKQPIVRLPFIRSK